MCPVFIDLEASSLNKCFPIEVGWVEVDGDNRLRGEAQFTITIITGHNTSAYR